MTKTLDTKLDELKQAVGKPPFILADAKDADMAFGIASPGRNREGKLRSLADYRAQIREVVAQGLIDIMLMSASTSEVLTLRERIFEDSGVTPAVRANDTTDIHLVRGSRYATAPSRPFSSTTIDHIQSGKYPRPQGECGAGPSLGLYSITFNNLADDDARAMREYKRFRLEAEQRGFRHFLEVFAPNVPAAVHGIDPSEIPGFMNDHIVRLLAGVTSTGRPLFLKIPYFGPGPLEELCAYDPSLVVGVLGGTAGTCHDAFALIHDARRYGARVALFGRKINAAEHQLSFIQSLRLVADGLITPVEAVKLYRSALAKLGIRPYLSLVDDMELTLPGSSYGA